ncbi:MAG TPA: beta-N-acetylhexosaminidase, partial [Candidatus Binatia bacterium]|nr:beta-N-acetylhexosaminidase [Candidatus Binatia bacterium]
MENQLRRKIGQLFMVGVQGESLTAEERLCCEEYGFGGFVLFQRNCCEPGQIVSLCRDLWGMADALPPFIAIDQEGGRVHRLPVPFTHFPPAGLVGRANDSLLAYRAGQAIGVELALAGINLNFAPVLDVNSNPGCPVIGNRAFAADPGAVVALSARWSDGLRDAGIVPCGKHFPGHGAADKDSHFELPIISKTLESLQTIELPSFAAACRRIEALMTAHVLYPALDPQWPATLSKRIVTDLLRRQFGYPGVVFSDDMEMHAISQRYSVEESAWRSIHAGVDALLFCHELSKAVAACEFLCAKAAEDAALRERVTESFDRIAGL